MVAQMIVMQRHGSVALAVGAAVTLCACGDDTVAGGDYSPKSVPAFGVGVAHVAGQYSIRSAGEAPLLAGARRAHELGARTIKLYLTPEYATKYPQAWPNGIHSLASLVSSAPYREVLSLPFDTVVFTTYSFAMGVGDPWRERDVPGLLEAEAREFEELVEELDRLSPGGRRTYVFQNWEGDWSLTAMNLEQGKDAARAKRMAQWLTRRHRAVADAAARRTNQELTFATAIEVNRVLDSDDTRLRVLSDVLPQAETDLVSYSAWESTDVGALADSERTARVASNLTAAIAKIRSAVPKVGVYLGELGFPERELGNVGELTRAALDAGSRSGVLGSVYWQIFDNECSNNECRGLWVLKPDGSLGDAGQALAERWNGRTVPSAQQ
jgi:hypothetical protein